MKNIFNDLDQNTFKQFHIDCAKCCGICCFALFFSKIDGFPEDKPVGKACENLLPNHRCKIHSKLKSHNLKGCISYDCFGAGQKVTKLLEKKINVNNLSKHEKEEILRLFLVIFQIHQILWYLQESLYLTTSNSLKEQIEQLKLEGNQIMLLPVQTLVNYNLNNYHKKANEIFKEIIKVNSNQFIHTTGKQNYIGKNLRYKDLNGKDFSMTLLIATNLEQANLNSTIFLGADMRDTNIKNTDLSNSIFHTQMQINSAHGNSATKLPPHLQKPSSWDD